MNLANNLRLSIDLVSEGTDEWLKLKLEDDLNLQTVETDHLLTPYATQTAKRLPDRAYHIKEGLVIAMRRLVSQAVAQDMISVYPGMSSTLSTPPPSKASSSTTSWIEPEL
jgi:hypothetical protein